MKFSKGEKVRVTIYSEFPDFWYIGEVVNINIDPKHYEVLFQNSKGDFLKYWFYEDELRKFDKAEERDILIDKILAK